MAGKVYKMLELVGASEKSFEDAVNVALQRAGETVRNLDWFEVKELRGSIAKGKVSQYQAKVQIGFRLDSK